MRLLLDESGLIAQRSKHQHDLVEADVRGVHQQVRVHTVRGVAREHDRVGCRIGDGRNIWIDRSLHRGKPFAMLGLKFNDLLDLVLNQVLRPRETLKQKPVCHSAL
jgi:hypothetical protein